MTYAVVSVIVTGRNAAMVIGDLLEALDEQTYVGPFEVIVVDLGSTDGTSSIVSLYHRRFASLVVLDASARLTLADARNVGAISARGDVLVFCDAADVVDSAWLDRALAELIHVDLVGDGIDTDAAGADAALGRLAMRTNVFRDLDGFCTSHGDAPGEIDSDIVRRAVRAGYRSSSMPDFVERSHRRRPRLRHACDI